MTLRIAAAELTSMFFLLVILGSLLNNYEKKESDHNIFSALTLCTMFGLFFDASSYIADSLGTYNIILVIVNIMAFSTIHICIALFSVYMMMLIRRTKEVSYKPIYPILIFSVLNVLWIILGACNGMFFSVQNHQLVYGPWQEIITVMPVAGVIYILVILLVYSKSLGRRMTLVLGSFVVFPLNAAVVLLFFPDIGLAYVATALSCAVMFTFVRREEISEAQVREQIMSELSVRDSLTGLLNRRGFNEAMDQAPEHDRIGIVFCDLNALKYTNDTFGHAAGDAYIQRFADILRKVYRDQGTIFRISGDEFIVVLYDISSDEFNRLKDKLNSTIRKNDRIASAGYAYGSGRSAIELFNTAEQAMYDDKSRYYTETGMDRRRRSDAHARRPETAETKGAL